MWSKAVKFLFCAGPKTQKYIICVDADLKTQNSKAAAKRSALRHQKRRGRHSFSFSKASLLSYCRFCLLSSNGPSELKDAADLLENVRTLISKLLESIGPLYSSSGALLELCRLQKNISFVIFAIESFVCQIVSSVHRPCDASMVCVFDVKAVVTTVTSFNTWIPLLNHQPPFKNVACCSNMTHMHTQISRFCNVQFSLFVHT